MGKNMAMPMRTDCRHYESRTYPSGDIVRRCRLDLAPEAPWRCPENCSGYARRTVDVAWNYGSLGHTQSVAPEPEPGAEAAAVLDAAEDIVNEAGRDLIAEMEQRESRKGFFKKRRKR